MRRIRKPFVPALLLAAAVSSCRGPSVPVGIEPGEEAPAGGGISVTAVLPDDPAMIEKLFRAYPPDSGVIPVYLTVTNDDTTTVVLHSLGNLPLGDRFRSITLDAGDGPVDPIHPLEVVMRLAGKTEAPNYKQMGAWHVVGGLLIPPLGIYYAFKWGGYALDYRPMLRNSFFPAGRGGSFEPVVIAPGETAAGFLFFPLGPPRSPYYTEYEPGERKHDKPVQVRRVRAAQGLELSVRPAEAPGATGALRPIAPGFEAVGMRRVRAEAGDLGTAAPDLFVLGRERDAGGRLDLLIGSARGLSASRSIDAFVNLVRLNNDSGELVDASSRGRFAVCAVNFNRRSRLYSVDLGGAAPALAADLRFDRPLLRVFALPMGVCAVTDDGFCGIYRYEDLKRTWYGRLGTKVSDAACDGERILTFGGDRIDEFLCEDGRCEGPRRSAPAPDRGILQGIRAGGSVLVAHKGKGALGDTLVLYDTGELRERARLPLPGKIEAVASSGTLVAVQVEGGVLMLFETRNDADPSLVGAGWLPERALALTTDGETGIFISPGRELYAFGLDAIRPEPAASGPVRVPVTVSSPGVGER
jgi:hypothetical protein